MSRLNVVKDRPGTVRTLCHDSDRKQYAEFLLVPTGSGQTKWTLAPVGPAANLNASRRPLETMERVSSALAGGPLSVRALRTAVEGGNDDIALAADLLRNEGFIDIRREGASKNHYLLKRFKAYENQKAPPPKM